ncbi:glycosyltransferase family 4 protein [Methylophaga sp.]|uniref:glycosyltransferase family 4 protein n=1 Tax=Methylophaga sp. TaxID=2024840 RepID=UPI00271EBF87|nr:glycosyltransferase family 4 protein [Methylophaga sp.]MDO8828403.1 glycosyltransferase family 4 protein [Methylophaga sp.]
MAKKQIRVLHFFKTYFPDSYGGIEQVINQIARGSAAHGIETHVLSLSKTKVERTITLNGHKVHRAKQDFYIASTGISFSVFLRFSQLAKQADVIHYHFPWPLMDMVHLLTRVNKPSVVTYHSDIVRQKRLMKFYQPLKNSFLSSVDRIVATSPNYLKSSDVLKRFKEKVEIIPIGIDKSLYPTPEIERVNEWRHEVGDKFFLFVGVLRYYKGLHILIEAARTADYPIVIVGAGPVEMELKALADSFGLRNIYFAGRVSDADKVALLELSYAVVFPSHLRSEAFGISLLEGAMYGKPMISSEIGTGTTFINIDGETGIVVPPSDPAALSQAMSWLWDNPVAASQMGIKAEKRYWQLFTADEMVEKYAGLYRDLVKRANL